MEKLMARFKAIPRRVKILLAVLGCILLLSVSAYLTFVYSNHPFIKKWRTIYIETAMTTYTHQWLATAFIPQHIIDAVMEDARRQQSAQEDLTSTWDLPEETPPEGSPGDPFASLERRLFYETYWELDGETFDAFLSQHPDLLTNGYPELFIDNLEGRYALETTMGEPVCLLDAVNNLLIVEVSGEGYRGKLAVVKDPAQVILGKSASLGSHGNTLSMMGPRYGALLGINASGFADPEWKGNGGNVIGSLVIDGVEYGNPNNSSKFFGFKEDNRLYIENYSEEAVPAYRWAIQFSPALIVDGEVYVQNTFGYGLQPRSAVGQSRAGEVLLLIIDGRQMGHSIGATVSDLADIMLRHNAYQAMNLDGGSSALMWYDGESITKPSSVTNLGRYLPNGIFVLPASAVESQPD